MAATRVALSCEWTSLTSSSTSRGGIIDLAGARTGIGRARHPGRGAAATAAKEAPRKSRRVQPEGGMAGRYQRCALPVVRTG